MQSSTTPTSTIITKQNAVLYFQQLSALEKNDRESISILDALRELNQKAASAQQVSPMIGQQIPDLLERRSALIKDIKNELNQLEHTAMPENIHDYINSSYEKTDEKFKQETAHCDQAISVLQDLRKFKILNVRLDGQEGLSSTAQGYDNTIRAAALKKLIIATLQAHRNFPGLKQCINNNAPSIKTHQFKRNVFNNRALTVEQKQSLHQAADQCTAVLNNPNNQATSPSIEERSAIRNKVAQVFMIIDMSGYDQTIEYAIDSLYNNTSDKEVFKKKRTALIYDIILNATLPEYNGSRVSGPIISGNRVHADLIANLIQTLAIPEILKMTDPIQCQSVINTLCELKEEYVIATRLDGREGASRSKMQFEKIILATALQKLKLEIKALLNNNQLSESSESNPLSSQIDGCFSSTDNSFHRKQLVAFVQDNRELLSKIKDELHNKFSEFSEKAKTLEELKPKTTFLMSNPSSLHPDVENALSIAALIDHIVPTAQLENNCV